MLYRLTRRLASSHINPLELMESVRNFEEELQHLYRSLADSDRYDATIFARCRRPARILMVHESWHQCYCELYRIFLTGYREAAPASALEGIDRDQILKKRILCLNHALSNVQILTSFSQQCEVRTVDFDTAICAYNNARIILFSARTDVVTKSLSMATALEKARFCQDFMNRFFPSSPVVEPMVSLGDCSLFSILTCPQKKELEMLIARHSTMHSTNAGLQLLQPEEDVGDDESRLAAAARVRQRLAIHSLLRRAEFVDDSNEVTSPAPASEQRPSTNSSSRLQQQPETRNNSNANPDSRNEVSSNIFEPNGMPYEKSNTAAVSTEKEPSYYLEEDQGRWSEEMRIAFNPWMGWPETLETYGFSQDLDNDYF